MNYKEEAIKRCSKISSDNKDFVLDHLKILLKEMYGLRNGPNREQFAVNFDYERKVLNEMFTILNK
jgi:hypothetical protein